MKLKILLSIVVIAMVGGSVTVLVVQSRQHPLKPAPPESQLPTAISNYSKTFKLNTNPPIWTQPTNGNQTH
ncbi:MAG TPA: hypothetical protein VFY06_04350 [Verrucomicrobiae bacterium]|nr:hypothetical protein [Verrucomicrobiae bacterium]